MKLATKAKHRSYPGKLAESTRSPTKGKTTISLRTSPSTDGAGDFDMVQTLADPLKRRDHCVYEGLAVHWRPTDWPCVTPSGVDKAILRRSLSWANSSLTGTAVLIAEKRRFRLDTILTTQWAYYVLGVANEVIGVETTRVDPSSAKTSRRGEPIF